jgi:hypothetical protein
MEACRALIAQPDKMAFKTQLAKKTLLSLHNRRK